jgi:hypothetical protein
MVPTQNWGGGGGVGVSQTGKLNGVASRFFGFVGFFPLAQKILNFAEKIHVD